MGCTSSKLDDLPAIALCRERCQFLEEAIRQRYALAEAHVAYIHSLKQIGLSLEHFFNQDLDNSIVSPPSPVLPLPTQRKGDPVVSASVPITSPPKVAGYQSHTHSHSHSNSNSGSHLHFHSDTDDDDDADSGSLHHSGNSSPLHYHHDHDEHETLGSMPGGFMNMNYMRNRSTVPSVVYEQHPMNPETVHSMGESSYYPYNYPNYPNQENPNPYPYYNYPPSYGNYGFYGSPPPYGSSSLPPAAADASTSSSKPPPPPPSPPRNSPWDFLNPFETVEKYYTLNTPSRDSKELREEEGIPDLEDENYQDEVVKEVHEDQKYGDGGGKYSKMVADEGKGAIDGKGIHEKKPSVSDETNEYDVHLVDKNVVAEEDQANVAAFKARVGSRGVSEVIIEIKVQFERASASGIEVSKMLEAGKIPYPRKNVVYQVSSKMLHSLSVSSSQPSTSNGAGSSSSAENASSVNLDLDEGAGMSSRSLSSTLHKLQLWEKKLYEEVKSEEKMRIVHERKRQRLKRLDEKGAEAHKVDPTRTLVRTLSTKIRIAIQVVDKISIKINKLRDEELLPQINELISGLIIMWKVMLECHQNQCQAIAEAKKLDAVTSNRKFSDARLQATMQLEQELLKWVSNFGNWIGAQKGYIKALNGWLLKCLVYEPEETPDGIVPFSPGRIGAPPVFVTCNQWSQAMERISGKEVIVAMVSFATSVRQLREWHSMELHQRTMANKAVDKNVKTLGRDEQKMQKEWQAMDKKMVLVSGQQTEHQSDPTNISIQSGLKQIFEAMERFTANSMQTYEELRVRNEEYRLAQENMRVS